MAALVATPTAAGVAAPAHAAAEVESWFSYQSTAGDWIGQGGSGTVAAPSTFSMSGTAGSLRFRADTDTTDWTVELAAASGRQLTTGTYQNVARAGFNDTAPGLAVSATGRACNKVKGSFTIYAISADTAGRITSLDATLQQFCDDTGGGMTATVKYAAPYVVPLLVTSSNPTTVDGQPVTFTARALPGTAAGGVAFYDGGVVIGQASFDAAGTARFETSRLAVGSHSITVRMGGATSGAVTQTVLDGATSLWFGSEAGDWIGQGALASYAPPTSTLTVRGTAADVSVSVEAPASGEWWTVTLAAPLGQTLARGFYPGATRAPFREPGEPGLSVSGSGRGCNTLTGSFTVDRIESGPDGSVAVLDATFHQFCGTSTSGLHGRVRWHADAPTPPSVTTTVLTSTSTGPLTATLTASVSGGTTSASGQVTFTEGPMTLGSVTLGTDGRASFSYTGTRGTHTVTATYGGSPTHAGSSGTTQLTLAGIATATTFTVPKTAKAGKPVTIPVTVTAGSAQPTGTVRLHDGVEPVATQVTLVGGRATITWTPVAKGNRSLTVRFAGDGTFAPSVSAAAVLKVT